MRRRRRRRFGPLTRLKGEDIRPPPAPTCSGTSGAITDYGRPKRGTHDSDHRPAIPPGRAGRADAIALAHRDSIQSLGPARYPQNVVDDWQEGLTEDVYRNAMQRGEVFFIATADVDGSTLVLGFSSDYVIEGSTHGTSM